jgi:hypothetical protein
LRRGGIGDDGARRTDRDALLGQKFHAPVTGQGMNAKALRVTRHHVQRAGAD